MRPPEAGWARVRRCGPLAALVLALLLPQGLLAQGPRFLRDTTFPRDPIEVLLEQAAQLGLTAEQVSHLTHLQQQLHASNDPLVAQLVAIRRDVQTPGRRPRDMSPAQREAFRAAVQRARPIMQAIGQNNYQAMQQVGAVLTPAQKDLVREWLRHPATPPGPMPHGAGGRGAGPGSGGAGPRFRGGR